LNQLSNLDKHRACNFTLPHNRNATLRIHCSNRVILGVTAEKPLYLGDVHPITLPIDKRLVENGARAQASGTFVLAFREESDWDDMPVMQVLQDCFDHIEREVIGQLKPFFERPY